MADIREIRIQIDETDEKLVELLVKRLGLAAEIADCKIENGLEVFDGAREEAVLKRVAELSGEEYDRFTGEVFDTILKVSKDRQEELIELRKRMRPARYGLVGEKLGHSYSNDLHNFLGYEYALWEAAPDDLEDFIRNGDYEAINVTIPYKKEVMKYLDEVSELAQRLGAVNVVYRRDGKLIGTNTDYTGLKYAAERAGIDFEDKVVLVLGGTGGAGGMATVLAKDEGAKKVYVASRSAAKKSDGSAEQKADTEDAESEADSASVEIVSYRDLPKDADIIINATPVGTYPDTERMPVSLSRFENPEAVIDMIYNPLRTSLIQKAQSMGLKTASGLAMLVRQGTEAAGYFRGGDYSDRTEQVLEALERKAENIVLIGMPGCGKTTIAKRVGRKLGREVVDIDREIAKRYGRTPAEIIEQDGEEAFREKEAYVISLAAKERSQVIATGGGSVKRQENIEALKRNGRIFLLERDIDKLSTKGRPLSKGVGLERLFEERTPLYDAAADEIVVNNGESFTPAAREIISRYERG